MLDRFDDNERLLLGSCFLQAFRQGTFRNTSNIIRSQPPKTILGRTIRDSAGYLAEKFRDNQRKSPFHQPDRQHLLSDITSQLFRAWGHADPPVRRNCAITPRHLRFLHLFSLQRNSHMYKALSELITGAFFFACRSCEYLRVVTRGRTKLL
jgi:hypothetical protein